MTAPYWTSDDGDVTPIRTCASCAKPANSFRRGWCRPCYLRWFKAGKPDSGPPPIKNDALERWRQAPSVSNTREPTDLDVGTAGEHLVCADLLLAGYRAFMADQNCPYDTAVDLDGRLIRLQVKSTRRAKATPDRLTHFPAYQWGVRRAGKGGRRLYGDNEFDLLALVALDIRLVAYLPPSARQQTIHIRPPGTTSGKQFEDFPFAKAFHNLGMAP